MKKWILAVSGSSLLVILLFRPATKTTWIFDKSKSHLGFIVSHIAVMDVRGDFKTFNAKFTSVGDDFTGAEAEMTAEAGSMDSDHSKLDKIIQSPKYLDVQKFPSMFFKSKSFKKNGGNAYKMTGDLTIKGITKTVVLDVVENTGFNLNPKKNIVDFTIKGKIKRSDFDVGSSMPATIIGEDVLIFAVARFSRTESLVAK